MIVDAYGYSKFKRGDRVDILSSAGALHGTAVEDSVDEGHGDEKWYHTRVETIN